MSRRHSSITLLLFVLAAAAGAIWLISTGSRPALAVYDSMPAPPAPDTLVTDTRAADASVAGTPAADSTSSGRLAPRAADTAARPLRSVSPFRARVPAATDTALHPHRSDNYGGYSGYGSKERRGDPNAR
jgi:hypothetical protein